MEKSIIAENLEFWYDDKKAVVLGIDIKSDPKSVQQQIGICYEKINLYEQMSALENLTLFAKIFDVKYFDGAALLQRVGLGDRVKDKVETFSKGLKQRLMVARALVSSPKILFLDVPTDGLNPVSAKSIKN
jgi:ABC-2 type transport system ATP-binding protein